MSVPTDPRRRSKMTKTMTSRRWLSAIGSALLLQTSSAIAAEQQPTLDERLAPSAAGGLTPEQVAARAPETSFDAPARREAIRAAEGKLEQATVGYIPNLTPTPGDTPPSPPRPLPLRPGNNPTFP